MLKNKKSLFALITSKLTSVHEVPVVLENCNVPGEQRLFLHRYKSQILAIMYIKIKMLSVRFSVDAATHFAQLIIKAPSMYCVSLVEKHCYVRYRRIAGLTL
jgi:hypothetical protein